MPLLIQFVPERPNNKGRGEENNQKCNMLKAKPKRKSATANISKFSYTLFKDKNVEDLIRFLDTFKEILKNKPPSTANSKFAFFRTMLTG